MRHWLFLILIAMFSFFSCSLIKERRSDLLIPDGIEKTEDVDTKYPLIIYLHGAGRAGKNDFLKNIGINDPESIKDPTINHAFNEFESCFLWIPETRGDWDTRLIIKHIEKLNRKQPIDPSRIYVIGFSMGGPATFRLANDYYDKKHQLFAAIIRLTGQSQTQLKNEVASNTAVWLHVGLDDLPIRVEVSREAFANLKKQNGNAQEIVTEYKLDGKLVTTKILKESDRERIKSTEYEKVGHGISGFPFENKDLLAWLFQQKLAN